MLVHSSISLVVTTLAEQHFPARHYKLYNYVIHSTLYISSLFKHLIGVQLLSNPGIIYTTLHCIALLYSMLHDCSTLQFTSLHFSLFHSTPFYSTLPYFALLHSTLLYLPLLASTPLYFAQLNPTLPHPTLAYSTLFYSTLHTGLE